MALAIAEDVALVDCEHVQAGGAKYVALAGCELHKRGSVYSR